MYHDYYDILNKDYDYSLDVEFFIDRCKIYNVNFRDLLEIGCGTGRHTALLSKHFRSVVAIDIDAEMVKKARRQMADFSIENASILHMSALELPVGVFGVACSFFNVINYIHDDLIGFFSRIAASLSAAGIFVFDCLDSSQKYQEKASFQFTYGSILRKVDSTYCSSSNELYVNEHCSGLTHPSIQNHRYKIWNPEQIEWAAGKAGFNIVFVDNKVNVNSKFRKTNQSIFILKKGM